MKQCDTKQGPLTSCAPLAMSYTPPQQSSEPAYESKKALARGTLFPGLDLPFMNVVNKPDGMSTPLCELMALDFVVQELKLYLDTHPQAEILHKTEAKAISPGTVKRDFDVGAFGAHHL